MHDMGFYYYSLHLSLMGFPSFKFTLKSAALYPPELFYSLFSLDASAGGREGGGEGRGRGSYIYLFLSAITIIFFQSLSLNPPFRISGSSNASGGLLTLPPPKWECHELSF